MASPVVMTRSAESGEIGPTPVRDRILALDVLRGVAILGILLVNIELFSMVSAAWMDPTGSGDATRMDVAIWTLVHIFAEGKFISLLSVVFGAGIFLMAQRLEERTAHPERAYYRRMAGLLLIGAVHAYLFWSGDILVSYAICGACVYPLRRLRPRTFLLVAGGLLLAGSALEVVAPYYLAPTFFSFGSSLMRSLSPWTETADYAGNWITEMAARVPMAVQTETYALVSSTFWRVAGLMAAGMAFAKLGFFRGSAKKSSLLWVALVGCLLGVVVAYAGAILHKLFG